MNAISRLGLQSFIGFLIAVNQAKDRDTTEGVFLADQGVMWFPSAFLIEWLVVVHNIMPIPLKCGTFTVFTARAGVV